MGNSTLINTHGQPMKNRWLTPEIYNRVEAPSPGGDGRTIATTCWRCAFLTQSRRTRRILGATLRSRGCPPHQMPGVPRHLHAQGAQHLP
eukprot:5274546-Amphidinium_carterae.1